MSKTVPIYTDNDAVVVMRNMFPEDWNPIQLAYELPPIKVYQPYEVEQILVPDNANCLAVQAFLKICQLKFQIEPRPNAEYMSPSGNKGISPSKTLLSPDAKADMRAYISLVNNVFVNAELYICWVENTTYETITKQRYGSVYPWPLNHLLNGKKRKEVIKKLTLLGWYNKTIDDICGEVKNCCTALSSKLKDNKYFFGDNDPNELDALVFGHIFTIITTPLPGNILANIVRSYPRLLKFCDRFETSIFSPRAIVVK
ncbi:hypothetical protein KM043_011333 [Ampulex compressa]|nr:hypothetical protein KM043_011333 [Ampulex compressa]